MLPDAESLIERLLRQLRAHVSSETGMVGIVTGGAWLAERLHRSLGLATPLGRLDISFYRDDFDEAGLHHQVKPSQIPFDVQGRKILLVDDVLYTGRTVRAAMNELFDYGRPAAIELAVLVDRGGRELPIAAQYTGETVAVPPGKILVLDRDDNGALSLHLSDRRRERTTGDARR
ncbi:MAG: bifunctional pyr operon transcriptional regulator/uracil phosphoribosyltransferase PyrR [Betaproteobacteria bacterium]|nr:bifunctional pyr operon transcriptional regulator/uracil phosphoribosyltransferase PyrR [Betaproteobacteria bacterium]MBI2961225.1 bifunctional pyr operon transcriptional regulator/uracil phosphoribosyltransferase PyrR [Betaproteobacteria bacterium]